MDLEYVTVSTWSCRLVHAHRQEMRTKAFKFLLACLLAVHTLQATPRASGGEQFTWWRFLKKNHCGFFWGNTCFWLTSDLPDKTLSFQKAIESQYCIGASAPAGCYCLKLSQVSSQARSGPGLYHGPIWVGSQTLWRGRLSSTTAQQQLPQGDHLFTGNTMLGLCTLIFN